ATVRSGDTIADVTQRLAAAILASESTKAYLPLVSGSQVTLASGWPTGQQPSAGRQYFIAPVNLNFRVNEPDQVDTLNVFHGNSPADDVGVLTESTLTGLGMGGDTVVGGRVIPGGITYSNLEAVNVNLGYGNNHFTIETTHAGTTTVTTDCNSRTATAVCGNNTIDVR